MRPSVEPIAPAPTQTTSPDVQRASRSAGSWWGRRARRMSRSSADATSGAPCSWATTSTSASTPRRFVPMPCQRGRKRARVRGIDRFHLLAERGERPPPELPQDVVVAPLALDAVGPELAPDDPALDLEPLQRGPHRLRRHPVATGGVLREERTMGAGVAGDEVEHRVGHRLGAAPRAGRRARRRRARRAGGRHPRPRTGAPPRRSTRGRRGARPRADRPSPSRAPRRRTAGPARRSTAGRAVVAGRAARRRHEPDDPPPGAAARARGRRARRRR